MSQISNNSSIGTSWEEIERALFTPEEIAASNLRVAIIEELLIAKQEKGISRKKLAELSGI